MSRLVSAQSSVTNIHSSSFIAVHAIASVQGTWNLNEEYVVNEVISESTSVQICDLVSLALTTESAAALLLDELVTFLELSLTSSALDVALTHCQEFRNGVTGILSAVGEEADSLLQQLADGADQLNVTRVLQIQLSSSTDASIQRRLLEESEFETSTVPSHSRQLMAVGRSSRGKGTGENSLTSDIRHSADVSSQNWTLADLDITSAPIIGAALVPRILGHRNILLGGLVRTVSLSSLSRGTCSGELTLSSPHLLFCSQVQRTCTFDTALIHIHCQFPQTSFTCDQNSILCIIETCSMPAAKLQGASYRSKGQSLACMLHSIRCT